MRSERSWGCVAWLVVALVLAGGWSPVRAQQTITGSGPDIGEVQVPEERLRLADAIGERRVSLGPALTLDGGENSVQFDFGFLAGAVNLDEEIGEFTADLAIADIGVRQRPDERNVQTIEFGAGPVSATLVLSYRPGLAAITGSAADPGATSYRVTVENGLTGQSRSWTGQVAPHPTTAGSHVVGLLLDSSGSMDQTDPNDRRVSTAKMLLDHLLETTTAFGIDFDDEADLIGQASTPDGRTSLKAAIETVDEDGSTNIAGSLLRAARQYRGSPPGGGGFVAVLLTDGEQTAGPPLDSVVDTYRSEGWPIITVGLTDRVNDQVLLEVARRTGGKYFRAWQPFDLAGLFDYVGYELSGYSVVESGSGTVTQGGEREHEFVVDSSLNSLKVSLAWPGSDLDLTLVGPDGGTRSVGPDGYRAGATYEIARIADPEPGQWAARVQGAEVTGDTERYLLRSGGASAFTVAARFPGGDVPRVEVGDEVPVEVVVSGSVPRHRSLRATYLVRGPTGDTVASGSERLASAGASISPLFHPGEVGNYYVNVAVQGRDATGGAVFSREVQTSVRAYPEGHFGPVVTRVQGGIIRLDRGAGEFDRGDRIEILGPAGGVVARARIAAVYPSWSQADVTSEFGGGPEPGMEVRTIEY